MTSSWAAAALGKLATESTYAMAAISAPEITRPPASVRRPLWAPAMNDRRRVHVAKRNVRPQAAPQGPRVQEAHVLHLLGIGSTKPAGIVSTEHNVVRPPRP